MARIMSPELTFTSTLKQAARAESQAKTTITKTEAEKALRQLDGHPHASPAERAQIVKDFLDSKGAGALSPKAKQVLVDFVKKSGNVPTGESAVQIKAAAREETSQAERNLAKAQDRLDKLIAGGTPTERKAGLQQVRAWLDAAEADVMQAKAQLKKIADSTVAKTANKELNAAQKEIAKAADDVTRLITSAKGGSVKKADLEAVRAWLAGPLPELNNAANALGFERQTRKFPSDNEDGGGGGGVVTEKAPSDNEDGGGGGGVTTAKHPSDLEDGGWNGGGPGGGWAVTMKAPSDHEDGGGGGAIGGGGGITTAKFPSDDEDGGGNVGGGGGIGAVTEKAPSDNEDAGGGGGVTTAKHPSDLEDGGWNGGGPGGGWPVDGGGAVTAKYPSDNEDGGGATDRGGRGGGTMVTMKAPSDNEDGGGGGAIPGVERRVKPGRVDLMQKAFDKLDRAGTMQWNRGGVMEGHLGVRFERVPLRGDNHPDGYQYTAFIPLGALTPTAPQKDPNKVNEFYIERTGGIAGLTQSFGPIAIGR